MKEAVILIFGLVIWRSIYDMMHKTIRYSSECRRRCALELQEDLSSHDEDTGIKHDYINRKRLQQNCHRFENNMKESVVELGEFEQTVERAIQNLIGSLDSIKCHMQAVTNNKIREIQQPIRDWEDTISLQSYSSCDDVAQLVAITDPKFAKERRNQLKRQTENHLSEMETIFAKKIKGIIKDLQPFVQKLDEIRPFASNDGEIQEVREFGAVVPEQISEIREDSFMKEDSFEQLQNVRESLLERRPARNGYFNSSQREAHPIIFPKKNEERRDLAFQREKDKRAVQECSIQEIRNLQLVRALNSFRFNLRATVVRVLYFWVNKKGDNRLQVILGDQTGLASASLKYDKLIKKGVCLSLLACSLYEKGQTLYINCDDFNFSQKYAMVKETGYCLGRIQRVKKEWFFQAPTQDCMLIRWIGQHLRKVRQFRITNMVVEVKSVLEESGQKGHSLVTVADSSGIMFAVIRRKEGGKIQENDKLRLRNVMALTGKLASGYMANQEVLSLDSSFEGSIVESFPFPFWETSQEMIGF